MDRDSQRAGDVDEAEMSDVDTAQTNHLSFCAGYGGIDLALKSVVPDGRTIAYVEIEAFAIANLVAKMEAGELDQAPVWSNVKTFPAEDFYGLVDIISGGYPCQPFSAAGKRLGTEDPRHLWPYIRRAIRSIRPGRVFLENVEGHISLGLSTVLSDLDEDGYRATWGIFSAAECGAPHQRKRVFIMADSGSERPQRYWRKYGLQETGEEAQVGGCGSIMANSNHGGGTKDSKCGELWPERLEQPPRDSWPARPGEAQKEWEEPRTVADSKHDGRSSSSANRETGGGEPDERRPKESASVKQSSGSSPQSEVSELGNADSSTGRKATRPEQQASGTSQPGQMGNPGSAESCGLPDEARQDVSEVGDANRRQAEPQLGRATDGSASRVDATAYRVDRLRLLGNGVVPATAAKAWTVLSDRFE
jgi:DNA (cytosine-5)-methyltransferase 1